MACPSSPPLQTSSTPTIIGITIIGITVIIGGIITGTVIIITAGTTTDPIGIATIGTIVTIITGTTPTGTTGIITGTTIGTEPARRASCFGRGETMVASPLRVIVLPDLSLETAFRLGPG